jgi:hypothetical protein
VEGLYLLLFMLLAFIAGIGIGVFIGVETTALKQGIKNLKDD